MCYLAHAVVKNLSFYCLVYFPIFIIGLSFFSFIINITLKRCCIIQRDVIMAFLIPCRVKGLGMSESDESDENKKKKHLNDIKLEFLILTYR